LFFVDHGYSAFRYFLLYLRGIEAHRMNSMPYEEVKESLWQ